VGGNVERIFQARDFLDSYEHRNRPVVLAGVASKWQATSKWKDMNYLASMTKNRTFRATSGAAPLPCNFSIEAYHQYCRSEWIEEAPLYLFDRTALLEGPLKDDYYPDLQATCPFWDPSKPPHDLFQYLGDSGRPDHTWLIMGPKRSGSAFHMDPNATHAWNATIVGKKRWIFYPPGVTPPGVFPSKGGDSVVMPISIGEWLLNYYNQQHVLNRTAFECTVEPGDVVFVPHGWWHAVFNLSEVNIAITHNYVSQSNLPTVLRFLEHKKDQISGCRDREESIKPAFLLEAFQRGLEKNGIGHLVKEAQQVALRGWPCRAWTDEVEEKPDSKNKKRKRRLEASERSIMAKAKQNLPMDQTFRFSFL
jgi:hypothetical protein